MKRIVSISLGSARRDYRFVTTVLGQPIEVRRIGTNGDTALAASLVRDFDGKVDAIGLGGLTPVFHVGAARYPHHEAISIARQARRTPVVAGNLIKQTLDRWCVQQANQRSAACSTTAGFSSPAGSTATRWRSAGAVRR